MNPDYTISHDEANDEMVVTAGDGVEVYREPVQSYGTDYKRTLADAMAQEYAANGISDRLVEMMYVAFAETYSVE